MRFNTFQYVSMRCYGSLHLHLGNFDFPEKAEPMDCRYVKTPKSQNFLSCYQEILMA